MLARLRNSFGFFLTIRILGVLCSIIVLFCVALTEGWPTRLPAVFGLIFSLLGLLFISCSIATLFVWDLSAMSVAKRSLFVWVFLLCSLVAGAMFVIAPSVCVYYNQFGCMDSTYSPGFKVAAAFSFVNLVFAVFDVILNFVFLFRDRRDGVAPPPQCVSHVEPASVSIIDISGEDLWAPRKPPASTYV